ncbi:tRNA (adenosine(37)-N6)-threonylcarbamoyltransferase complex dimerization subunit type 1 TsaB [Clostridium aminobutyricum]|uniref:tRNA (Adenosine(37)-N6)-threonylcarbamoyltransferase complex dimerization subunit type 1 TsaB n=1 Tax=Clostridium aminobutyricum TaxID=33953 RepID=A0A939IHW7_CLOAM|nr:tRNA (adenosine(37)-N6)-threonylcarbamoyltransferase complex dimerization subunit type 1 TsaB [Clostridium aminobutyricum]MBN7774297.1 tRNA (adenosine(37)-N6)-threonylcarbamoyltransferase complex dimerization subunit type 1 TsaB [Clostridium aminobutyricum]
MNILAIETTGATASVAIINEKEQIFEEVSTGTLNHLQYLMPMIEKVLEKSQLQIGDLTAIAASEGPGSFTGIRIGVSSARALAQALQLKTISVPTLKTFLYNTPDVSGILCPIFDARRSQVYGGAYKWKENALRNLEGIEEIVVGDAYALEELLALLKQACKPNDTITFFGDGVEPYKEKIKQWQNSSLNNDIQVEFANESVNRQTASSVARLALDLYREGQLKEYQELKPNYMRKAEAERKLEESQGRQNE